MAIRTETISETGSSSIKTLTKVFSAAGVQGVNSIVVSPDVDPSKISYVIDKVNQTVAVTLTDVAHTSTGSSGTTYNLVSEGQIVDNGDGTGSILCVYENGSLWQSGRHPLQGTCPPTRTTYQSYYIHNFTITLDYKTFPELQVRADGQIKTATDGWVRVNGQLRQIQQIWVRSGGQLKEV